MNPELGESNEGDLVWLWNDIHGRCWLLDWTVGVKFIAIFMFSKYLYVVKLS